MHDGAARAGSTAPVVCSHNEWDPLEEVVVGAIDGAMIPPYHVSVASSVPESFQRLLELIGGQRYPEAMVAAAEDELGAFVDLLERQGITVRRPDFVDLSRVMTTPDWSSTGFCTACPRDGFMVVGDEIIETPMAWRSRYFEATAYRRVFLEYFKAGARWTAAPRPRLSDRLYDAHYRTPGPGEAPRLVIDESEVVFDAADFTRCGRDLFVTRSNATNHLGIEWLRRHLGEGYRIHSLTSRCPNPMHIDSSFIPLGPRRVMVNPDYLDLGEVRGLLKGWDILVAPRPDVIDARDLASTATMCSMWVNTNVLLLDPRRVVVEAQQTSMIAFLRHHGFEPIPLPFMNVIPFGGAFHCVTLDVRRRGALESYL